VIKVRKVTLVERGLHGSKRGEERCILNFVGKYVRKEVGTCNNGMAHSHVADGGTASRYGG
jgi:hypothetical protein